LPEDIGNRVSTRRDDSLDENIGNKVRADETHHVDENIGNRLRPGQESLFAPRRIVEEIEDDDEGHGNR
jgi:hypothetical protein